MPSKTITIDLQAYERLREARQTEDESFSRVIKRAVWHSEAPTAAAYLASLQTTPAADEDTIARLDAAQAMDIPPEDLWARDTA